MRREGSVFQGLGTVVLKELSDQMSSIRIFVLELLVAAIAFVALYRAIGRLADTTAEDPFVFLRLFTVDTPPVPSFAGLLGFLIPLVAIGLGFDSVSSEHNRRTLSRVLSQPIYRDALLMGKFLAGMATIGIMLLGLWLLVIGAGLLLLGVPPSGDEVLRSLVFLIIALFYCGVWLALAMLLSIVFRSAATSALVALGLWLFFVLIWPILSSALALVIAPPDVRYVLLGLPTPATVEMQQTCPPLAEPVVCESVLAILSPSTRRSARFSSSSCKVRWWNRAAAAAEPADRLAADRGPDCVHDRALRRRLRGVPAPGSARLKNRGACRPSMSAQDRVASDRQDRDDPMGTRIDDYDLVVDDEVFIASHPGLISTNTDGTGAIRTLDGTVVPTLSAMFTFVARGALLELMTVSRILVFCSVLSVTLEPALPPVVLEVDVEPLAPPRRSAASLRCPLPLHRPFPCA
jgi:ABC-2 type transport system permease protein